MRVASTGLGKTELICGIFDVIPEGDSLVLHAKSEGPEGCIGWHLKTYLEPQDIIPVLLGFANPKVMWAMIKSFIFPKKNPAEPEIL